MITKVVNKYKVNMKDTDVVYIGRGSVWGNPFSHKEGTKAIWKCPTREESIEAYRHWLWKEIKENRITKEMLLELDGKRLACYCAPKTCHGDVLVKAIEWIKGEDE